MRQDTRPVPLLRVGVRTVLGPDGEVEHAAHVHCPRRERAISVDECLVCQHCSGTVTREDETFVRCHDDAAVAALEPSRRRQVTDADATPLSAAMSTDVVCVRPDLRIEAVEYLMLQLGVSGAPVVDEDGRPIGVVSRSDLLRVFHIDPDCDGTVGDIMMPVSFCLPESATVSQAAALMAYEGIHRVPVLSSSGQVVGILSALDVARWLARHDGYLVPGGRKLVERLDEVCPAGAFDPEE